LLQFRRVRLKFRVVPLVKCGGNQRGNVAVHIALDDGNSLLRIMHSEVVLQPSSKEQRVHARTPFMMITGQQNRLLMLVETEERFRSVC